MRVHLVQNLKTDEVIYSNKFGGESAATAWIATQKDPKEWIHFSVDLIDIHWKSVKGMFDYMSNTAKLNHLADVEPQKQLLPDLSQKHAAISEATNTLQLAQADLDQAAAAQSAQLIADELASLVIRRERFKSVLAGLQDQVAALENPTGALSGNIRNVTEALKGLDAREAFLKLTLAQYTPAKGEAQEQKPQTAAEILAARKAQA